MAVNIQQVKTAFKEFAAKWKHPRAREVLGQFGVKTISELLPKDYGAVIAAFNSNRTAAKKTAESRIRDRIAGESKTIAGLCKLSGCPERAAAFIADGKSIDQVRAILLTAQGDGQVEINVRMPPATGEDQRQGTWNDLSKQAFDRLNKKPTE